MGQHHHLLSLKRKGEGWTSCATRLGLDAAFEDQPLSSCPFPEGFLRTKWELMYLLTREELTK